MTDDELDNIGRGTPRQKAIGWIVGGAASISFYALVLFLLLKLMGVI